MQNLAGQVQAARVQLTRAQSKLEGAGEQARLAKRRRKEAKQAARRARKEFKRAKAEFAEAEKAVAEAEALLAQAEEQMAKAARLESQPTSRARPGNRKTVAPPRVRRRVSDVARVAPEVPAPTEALHTPKGPALDVPASETPLLDTTNELS